MYQVSFKSEFFVLIWPGITLMFDKENYNCRTYIHELIMSVYYKSKVYSSFIHNLCNSTKQNTRRQQHLIATITLGRLL